jgi:hypothetical protein
MAVDYFNLHKPLSLENFHFILAIKAAFPKGLNSTLSSAFPDIVPITRPSFFPSYDPIDPNWIAGFPKRFYTTFSLRVLP